MRFACPFITIRRYVMDEKYLKKLLKYIEEGLYPFIKDRDVIKIVMIDAMGKIIKEKEGENK